MHCPSCDKKAPAGASFCPSCGAKLPDKGSNPDQKPQPDNTLHPDDTAQPDQTIQQTVQSNDADQPDQASQQQAQHPAGQARPNYAASQESPASHAPNNAADAASAASDSKPHTTIAKRKKNPRKLLAILAVVLLAGAAYGALSIFGNGNAGTSEPDAQASKTSDRSEDASTSKKDKPSKASNSDSGSKEDSEQDPDYFDSLGRFDDTTVSNIKIDPDAAGGPKVTLTVTNNRPQIISDAQIEATGTYTISDEYGDEAENTGKLSLICTEQGTNTIPYLLPGKNKIELIPESQDNIVATNWNEYTEETQVYRLQDLNDIDISIGAHILIDPDQYAVLDEDDYEINLDLARNNGSPAINATITNKTDYRWHEATVYLVAIDANGQLAHMVDGGKNSAAFSAGPLTERYFNVGETKEIQLNYLDGLDVDHFEVQRVVVQKETAKAGD